MVQLPSATPPDYHKIVSPTLCIPTDHTKPVPVGLLACQRDPLLRELSTVVVSSTIYQQRSAPGNNRKKKSAAEQNKVEPLLEVVLHDTVLFPEGGGQPNDIGIITTESGQLWDVVDVKRHGGHAVHYVRVKSPDEDAHHFAPGIKVHVALGDAGFSRRLDHMSMHTCQHLLSALLETHLDLPTLSWSLTAYPTPSYVELPRPLTLSEIAQIQAEANRLVFEGRAVHVEVEELDKEKQEGVKQLENGRTIGKGLPEDYTGGVKRVVVIEGVDRNPCCGTHLPTIHSLTLFLLPDTTTHSRSSSTISTTNSSSTSTQTTRLYFLSGPRLLMHISTTHSLLASTASLMSCGPPLVPERVKQVVEERKRAEKRVEDLEMELGKTVAQNLVEEYLKDSEAAPQGCWTKHVHRSDDSEGVLGFLQGVCFNFGNALEAEFKDASGATKRPYLLVITSSPSSLNAQSVNVVFVYGSDDKRVKEVGDGLRAKLGVKGGGKGVRWSGKFMGVWKEGKDGLVVEELLEDAHNGVHQ